MQVFVGKNMKFYRMQRRNVRNGRNEVIRIDEIEPPARIFCRDSHLPEQLRPPELQFAAEIRRFFAGIGRLAGDLGTNGGNVSTGSSISCRNS